MRRVPGGRRGRARPRAAQQRLCELEQLAGSARDQRRRVRQEGCYGIAPASSIP